MTFKEIFHFDIFFHRIKFDHSEELSSAERDGEINYEEKREAIKFYCSEWNQEYELIYLSYVLEE